MIINDYFKKREAALTDEALAAVEQTNKCLLPKAYKDFIKKYAVEPLLEDGECFQIHILDDVYSEIVYVSNFLDLDFLNNLNRFSYDESLENYIYILGGWGNTGFWLFVENTEDFGKVYYFDFDSNVFCEKGFCVANNFEEFMEKLKVVKAQF